MPAFSWILSQQPTSLPSRINPVQQSSSIQSGTTALIITGAFAVSVACIFGYKQYRRYRFRREIKMLERLLQQPHRKRMK